jgi:hypothetical protein
VALLTREFAAEERRGEHVGEIGGLHARRAAVLVGERGEVGEEERERLEGGRVELIDGLVQRVRHRLRVEVGGEERLELRQEARGHHRRRQRLEVAHDGARHGVRIGGERVDVERAVVDVGEQRGDGALVLRRPQKDLGHDAVDLEPGDAVLQHWRHGLQPRQLGVSRRESLFGRLRLHAFRSEQLRTPLVHRRLLNRLKRDCWRATAAV